MPPEAIERSVCSAIAGSPRRSRNSIADADGNFGALPQPPLTESKRRAQLRDRLVERVLARRLLGGLQQRARRDSRATIASLCARMSSRCCSHAFATPPSTCGHAGMPWRCSGGKYVPA